MVFLTIFRKNLKERTMKREMPDLKIIEDYARHSYSESNCRYGDNEYYLHINMVLNNVNKYQNIFKNNLDAQHTIGAAHTHDLIEDAKQAYSNIANVCGNDVADITLAVTDVPAENRLMKHLLTMGKTVKDHRAIILKMCDILANATYSKESGSSMYMKYVFEYQYRKPIFKTALTWYRNELDAVELNKLWDELDVIHMSKQIDLKTI